MNTQKKSALFVQIGMEKVKHPVLQLVIKIDDHVSADDQIEFNASSDSRRGYQFRLASHDQNFPDSSG